MEVPGADYYNEKARQFRGPVYYPRNMMHFRPEPHSKILDLGSGSGGNLIYYAQRGHDMTGVEFAERFCRMTEKFARRMGLEKVKVINECIEDVELSDRYDYVLMTEVLEHVVSPKEVIQKGLSFADKAYITSPTDRVGGAGHVRGISPEYLKEELEGCGWSVEELFTQTATEDPESHLRTVCIAKRAA